MTLFILFLIGLGLWQLRRTTLALLFAWFLWALGEEVGMLQDLIDSWDMGIWIGVFWYGCIYLCDAALVIRILTETVPADLTDLGKRFKLGSRLWSCA